MSMANLSIWLFSKSKSAIFLRLTMTIKMHYLVSKRVCVNFNLNHKLWFKSLPIGLWNLSLFQTYTIPLLISSSSPFMSTGLLLTKNSCCLMIFLYVFSWSFIVYKNLYASLIVKLSGRLNLFSSRYSLKASSCLVSSSSSTQGSPNILLYLFTLI